MRGILRMPSDVLAGAAKRRVPILFKEEMCVWRQEETAG